MIAGLNGLPFTHGGIDPRRRITETKLKGPTFESSPKNESNHRGSACYQSLIFFFRILIKLDIK